MDGSWFQENVFRAEVPALKGAVAVYLGTMKRLADELLSICAAALDVEDDFFARHAAASTHPIPINWHPPVAVTGAPAQGQFRIGPHAPDEDDPVSLVYFYQADRDTVVESIEPPLGHPTTTRPVVAVGFPRERLDAISVG